ncbi:MAG: CRTAC1 family protein, partial [Bacteroidetes bacterium]
MLFTELLKSARQVSFLLLLILSPSCRKSDTLFQLIKSSQSKIHFNNQIIENDSINQLDIENVYNGGGVGIGDFNKDGLPDIIFTGNLVPCKLYLNKTNFKFQDVTDEANVNGGGKWCRGVAVIDINGDGWQDIYVSATLKKKPEDRKNLLYINQGLDKNNIPFFKEEAAEYGLDDDSHTTQADFFDYDNDGDLDVYLVVNEISEKISPYLFRPVLKDGTNPSTGKLFRNEWSDSLKHPVFSDVSKQAGIQTEGYSHSAIITDINNDGWQDIYVGNDFLTNDLLWINNKNGTFTDQLPIYFKHISANSMGNDIEDINNDGLVDVISLDMNPEDNYRKKMMLPPSSYQAYQNTELYGYSYQYIRNTLQLNQGPVLGKNDSVSLPIFSEIGYYSGITATDWSWTPLLTDFDNDGYRDLIVCNGFPKDITDHDFAMFRARAFLVSSKNQILSQVPEVKLHNYSFRNNADLTFSDVSDLWGLTTPTFSNGAAYADLDDDGDLDLIINNINDEASLYRNNSREQHKEKSHYIQIQLKGNSRNNQGLGTWIEIYYDHGKKQVWENNPFRGYLSTIEDIAHFGTGEVNTIDSVVVKWQNGNIQVLHNIPADQLITADIADAGSDISSIR